MGPLTMFWPEKKLKVMYSKMVHNTCASHMLDRVATVILEKKSKTKPRSLIKVFFETNVNNWKKFDGRTRREFPMPCDTRWGTWLSCVTFLTQNLKPSLSFLKLFEQGIYVVKTVSFLGDSALITEMGHIYFFWNL